MDKDTTINAELKVLMEHTETTIPLPEKIWFFADKRIMDGWDKNPAWI